MATCNIIFWSIVVPTTIYGCKLWVLDNSTLSIIEEFQNYIGKKSPALSSKNP